MLKTRARDRARVGMDCTISIETSKRQNGGRLNFAVCVSLIRKDKAENKTAKVFTLNTALKGAISATIVNFLVQFTSS